MGCESPALANPRCSHVLYPFFTKPDWMGLFLRLVLKYVFLSPERGASHNSHPAGFSARGSNPGFVSASAVSTRLPWSPELTESPCLCLLSTG